MSHRRTSRLATHIQIAQSYIEEQLRVRDDIVAVLLVGSAASGEMTAFSDVDLRLIVEGRQESKLEREGIDRWVNGVYIDATLASADDYLGVDRILSDRGSADTMNFGRILYDQSGRFAPLQHEVQMQYMEPKWIHIRISPFVNLVAVHLQALRQAVVENELVNLHIHAGRVFAGLGFIPLLKQGIAVSSSRSMMQLVQYQPAYANSLLAVEGANDLSIGQVENALDVFAALSKIDPHREYKTLAGYMVGKARWMSRNGHHREAVHTGWLHGGNRASGCEISGDPDLIDKAHHLSAQWLSAVSWDGLEVLNEKLTLLNVIWANVRSTFVTAN